MALAIFSLRSPELLRRPPFLCCLVSSSPRRESASILNIDNIIMSPLNLTPEYVFKNRLSRDALRANAISAAGFSSPVTFGFELGEYFTRIGVGTPARDVYLILDTGSDVVWLQCLPCNKCYKQTYPIFNPNMSSSFSRVPCGSPLCDLLEHYGKCGRQNQCIYGVSYGDSSVSVGDFSTETLTFGKTKVRKVAFGCGHYNKGLFVAAAGLLGLGRGKPSFPVQAGNKFGDKFSYCLGNASQLIFGDSSSVYKNVIFTRLVTNPIRPELNTFYYVGLDGISVGGVRVPNITASMFKFDRRTGNGGVMFDSGTVVTRLAPPAYKALRDTFRKGTSHLKAAQEFFFLDTCYDLSGTKKVKVPIVELHFHGGANMSLPASNYIVPVDDNGKFCFAFAAMDGVSIIGNIQQQGFGMVFDLAGKQVGFSPNACS